MTVSSPPPGRVREPDEQALRLPGSAGAPRGDRSRGDGGAGAASWSCCRPTRCTASAPTRSSRRRSPRCWRPRAGAGHAAAGAGRHGARRGGAGGRPRRVRPGPDRRVLAGRAHPGVPGQPDAALGPGRHQGHGRACGCRCTRSRWTCSSRPGRWRCPAPTGTASPRRDHRGRGGGSSSARRSRSTWTAGPCTDNVPSTIVDLTGDHPEGAAGRGDLRGPAARGVLGHRRRTSTTRRNRPTSSRREPHPLEDRSGRPRHR